jgi:hypothetical protein
VWISLCVVRESVERLISGEGECGEAYVWRGRVWISLCVARESVERLMCGEGECGGANVW